MQSNWRNFLTLSQYLSSQYLKYFPAKETFDWIPNSAVNMDFKLKTSRQKGFLCIIIFIWIFYQLAMLLKSESRNLFLNNWTILFQSWIIVFFVFWSSLAESGYVARENAPQSDVYSILILIIKDQHICIINLLRVHFGEFCGGIFWCLLRSLLETPFWGP